MTDNRIRCLTVYAIAFSMAMLASHQAIPQSALEKKTRIKAANEKKKADAAAKKAKARERPQREADAAASADSPLQDKATKAQKATPKKTLREWHVGDQLPTDDFGGGFALQKNYKPDSPVRAAKDNDQPPAEGTYEYLKQQVLEVKRGQGPGGFSKPAIEQRQRAVDNLKALGPAAVAAVPALAWSATNERDTYVRRKAIEILGDIGGMLGVVAVSGTLLQPDNDPETAQAAEDSLLKLLSAVGSGLTMDDAIFLLKVHDSGKERVSPAIESAWTASGITPDDIAREIDRRAPAFAMPAVADAKQEVGRSKIQALCLKILHPDNNPETAKAAEDSLLKLLSAAGGGLTPRDGFFLYDVRRLGNKRLSPAIETAWEASGFTQYFMAKQKYEREHPGQEEAEAKAYAATHRGKRKPHIRDMPERWARWMMTPDAPSPDFAYWFNRVPGGSGETNAERRRAEIDRQNRERAANRVR